MYLDYCSDHPLSLKTSVVYSIFSVLRLKRLHSESEHILRWQIHLHHCFIQRQYPSQVVYKAWEDTLSTTRGNLFKSFHLKVSPSESLHMLITTYNRGNTPFQKIITSFWSFFECSNTTRDLTQKKAMVAYCKLPSLWDKLLRTRISKPITKS